MPIKLEFSESVGFIHKESVTMHGRENIKKKFIFEFCFRRGVGVGVGDESVEEVKWEGRRTGMIEEM